MTEDGAYVTFSRDRKCVNPYDLTFYLAEAHKFATIEKAISVMNGLNQLGEKTSIHSL